MTEYASFNNLRTAAVEAFVRTAILIDNEPRAGPASTATETPTPKTATSAAFGAQSAGIAPVAEKVAAPPPAHAKAEGAKDAAASPAATSANDAHQLQVRPVTNAFAGRKITCGFYFPADDEAGVVETALAAALHVDATIVDWQLKTGDSGPAKELIGRLILDDRAAGGRLRLIVIYTGERGLDHECGALHEHLKAVGLDDFASTDQGRALKASQTFITFANKPAREDRGLEVHGPASRPVPWDELPAFVLSSYAQLSNGLLQSFALKSIGAVRDDTHHLLSVFSPELDGAYLAQRAGIPAPTDAEEMMTSLLAAEFATSITDRGIEAEVLGGAAAALAVTARDPPVQIRVDSYTKEPIYENVVKPPAAGTGRHILADKTTLQSLVRSGLDTAIVDLGEAHRKSLDRQFFVNDEDALIVLGRFARLATFAREADPSRRLGRDVLNLTGGIIVRSVAPAVGEAAPVERFMLCVQPGCDAVRLDGEVAFPFCPLVPKTNVYDLIIRTDGSDKTFKVDRRPRALQPNELAAAIPPGKALDIMAVCAPCQPFSSQNRRRGSEDIRVPLILESVRIASALKPRLIIFENVPGIVGSQIFQTLKRRLAAAGYILGNPKRVDAADYGVPQRRVRCIVAAVRGPAVVRDFVSQAPKVERVTVRRALSGLRPLASGQKDEHDPLHTSRVHQDITLRRLAEIPKDGGGRDSLPPELQLACHRDRDPGDFCDVYGRMRWDDVAPTLTTGCTDVTRGRYAHPEQDRAITLREAARLQTFADSYRFAGNRGEIAKQIGNAVPFQMIRHVVSALRAAYPQGVRS